MNNVCYVEKNGIKRLGYIQNFDSYGDELQQLISEDFSFTVFNNFIDSEIDKGHIYYYDEHFEPVAEDSDEKKYKIIYTGYHDSNTDKRIYAGFEMKRTWCGALIGTEKDIFSKWENENSDENIYNNVFFSNIDATASILNKLTGKENDRQYIRSFVEDSYRKAVENDALYTYSSHSGKALLYFDAGIETSDGEKIWLISEPNTKKDALQKWYGMFFIRQSALIKRIFDMNFFNISDMVFDDVNHANEFINSLAAKAIKENWSGYSYDKNMYDLPLLKTYLENTYARLCRESKTKNGKIVCKDNFAYFNSGLLDRFYRQIFVRGCISTKKLFIEGIGEHEYSFLKDLKIFSENEPGIAMMFAIDELPVLASYCNNYQELIFDASLEIKLQDSHIFEDGVRRHRLPIYSKAYEECRDNAEKYDSLMADISRDFDSALKRMILISKRNYTVAVPQYVKDFDEIQFMLPIYLSNNNTTPDCVLSLKLEKDASVPYYRGTTILTPEMAVNNARLISGPELFWIDNIKSA